MLTNYIRAFYPRISVKDKLVYVLHGVQNDENLEVLEVTEINLKSFTHKHSYEKNLV